MQLLISRLYITLHIITAAVQIKPTNELIPDSLLPALLYTIPVNVAVAGNPVAEPVGSTKTPPLVPELLGASVRTCEPTVAAGPPNESV